MKYAALGRRSEITTIYAAKVRNGLCFGPVVRFGRRLKGLEVAAVCQGTREEMNSMGVNPRGNEALRMAEAAVVAQIEFTQ
jgi:hypothetical protein